MGKRTSTNIVDRFAYERGFLQRGVWPVAGIDEVGRGPLAGPVIAAAVVLPEALVRDGMPEALRALNDSKQLSAAAREDFYSKLSQLPELRAGVARVDPARIDAINILRATHEAMLLALGILSQAQPASVPVSGMSVPNLAGGQAAWAWPTPQPGSPIAHVLVDGRPVPVFRTTQTAIVKGDSLSYSIAAASVIAKVIRDRLMTEFDALYPGYGFATHMGYGTPAHLEAIARLGPCPIHRRSFAPIRPIQPDLFGGGL